MYLYVPVHVQVDKFWQINCSGECFRLEVTKQEDVQAVQFSVYHRITPKFLNRHVAKRKEVVTPHPSG